MKETAWQALAPELVSQLTGARTQAHWASQLLKAVGLADVVPVEDYSHLSLTWDAERRRLVSQVTRAGLRVALNVAELALEVWDSDGRTAAIQQLDGHSLAEGRTWLAETLTAMVATAGAGTGTSLELETAKMPPHPLAGTALFSEVARRELAELESWFANASALLKPIAAREAGASAVRCWPHHFDIATLITLDPEEPDPEKARSINLGMVPGDDSYSAPYFYVVPWPYADRSRLPTLAGGGLWRPDGWFGAVLTGSNLLAGVEAGEQASRAQMFLESALAASSKLLDLPTQ